MMGCGEPSKKKNWRLYHLLDLIPPVSTKQVQWNFRKVTLRHHYYSSYLVLYNKSRKFLYDAVGEDAYGFISSGTWGPLITTLGSTGTIILYCVFFLVEVTLLLIFFAFLGARVDDVITWSWDRVILPLMVFVCLALLLTLVALFVNLFSSHTRKESMAKIDRISPIGTFLAAAVYTCFPFVLALNMKSDPAAKVGDYLQYMAMPIVGDVLYYLTSLIWRWPPRLELQMQVDNNQPSSIISWGIFCMAFVHMGCSIAQWVLIGQKVDNRIHCSWYVVFIPFCFRACARVLEAFFRSWMKYTIGVRMQVGVAFDTLGSFFSNGILLISLYFVAVRIERGKHEVRMAHALIPVYITLAYIFICLIITFVVLLVKNASLTSDENRINYMWQPPPPKAAVAGTTHSGTSSSNAGPIPGEVRKDRDWVPHDDAPTATNTSDAFPLGLEDEVGVEEDYNDFFTDDLSVLSRHEPIHDADGMDSEEGSNGDPDLDDSPSRNFLSAPPTSPPLTDSASAPAAVPRSHKNPVNNQDTTEHDFPTHSEDDYSYSYSYSYSYGNRSDYAHTEGSEKSQLDDTVSSSASSSFADEEDRAPPRR